MSPTRSACLGGSGWRPGSRVLVISPTDAWGGAEIFLSLVLTALSDAGATVELAVPHVSATKPLYELATAVGVRTWNIGLYRPGGSAHATLRRMATAFREAVGVMRHVRPDKVLLCLPSPRRGTPVALAAAVLRKSLVAVFQYVEADLAFGALDRVGLQLGMRDDTVWIAVSAANASTLTGAFPPAAGHVRVVRNGVDAQPPPDANGIVRREARTAVFASLDLMANAQLVVSVGRLTAQKGYQYLIPAMELVRQELPDARFVWVGSGPDETSLRAAVAERGLDDIVRFAGFRSEVAVFLRAADLFVMPSLNEGTPFALLEAMSCEVPVAVADTPALTEVVADERLGWVFDVEDPAAIARVIRQALSDQERARSAAIAGRQWVESRYSKATMLEAIIDCVLGRGLSGGLPAERWAQL